MPKQNTAIRVAWIAGAFAIIAPVATYFVTKISDTYFFEPIAKDRRVAVEGLWKGTIWQEFRNQKVNYPADLDLEVKGRVLVGTLHETMTVGKEKFEGSFNMSGGFYHDRFARLEYASKAKGAVHFGNMILELSPDGKTLTGNFVAFGAYSQQIVTGPIVLTKQ